MRAVGHPFNVLASSEISTIHQGALRILREMGMEIQNRHLLEACAEIGILVDYAAQRARFPSSLVEQFIADAEKFNWEDFRPQVTSTAGLYHSLFHDPETGHLIEWTEEKLAAYFTLARSLPEIGKARMLGCRLPVAPVLEPLYERYYCWKYGAEPGGSIDLDPVCPHLLELYQAYADQCSLPIEEVFHANVYLVPALKLGVHEAYQVDYFREHGLRVGIGDMYAMGANTPVTVAGAVTLNLAEQLALGILNWALYGEKKLHLGCSIAPLDMRTMVYPFGRPESVIVNLMMAQLAHYYKASYSGHGGLTSAKLPSPEAGYQKALTAIPILLAGGNIWMDAGLLSCDEVCSPIQMVLDNEFLGVLDHLSMDFEVTPESLGIETILEAGPAGGYMDKEHTVRHFRTELWEPSIWTRKMLHPWLQDGSLLDVDYARNVALDIKQQHVQPMISDAVEKELLKVIQNAEKGLAD